MHVAVATPAGTRVASWRIAGDRAAVRAATVQGVLELALAVVAGEQEATPPR